MKRQQCTTPGCVNYIVYKSAGLCRRCYQRKWFQTKVMNQHTETTRIEMTIKSMMEKTINELRAGEDQIETGALRISHKVKVPRSDFAVKIVVGPEG